MKAPPFLIHIRNYYSGDYFKYVRKFAETLEEARIIAKKSRKPAIIYQEVEKICSRKQGRGHTEQRGYWNE